jgi:ribonucleoside-diphosphate reductase alpha chain
METNCYWLNKDSRKFLSRGYLLEGETAEVRIRDIAEGAEKILGIPGFADKFERYMLLGYYSLSSPIWSNFARTRGLPISCFGSYIEDTLEAITGYKLAEISMMTKGGGGTSAYFGALRGRGAPIGSGGQSTGSVHFMELYDKLMNVVSQGNVRRGSFAAYLPIDHPDIEEFLKIRGEGNSIQDMSIGVTVSDQWMREMVDGDSSKRKIWGLVIKKRFESGYPYIFFSDNANNNAPDVYKQQDMKIHASNLCTEIFLPTTKDESFVCDLSSMNLEKWDEFSKTDAVETLVYFLDAVMTEFINKTEGVPFMEAPRKFAIRHRALGVGVLGWHSLLQKKMIPFEGMEAQFLNMDIWKFIRERADAATTELAGLYGEPEVCKGYGRRNTTTLAIAPTTSSSFILGQVSPSIEPLNSNYFVKDLAKGKFTYRNPYLAELLKTKQRDNTEVWKDILVHGGSVQHLDFLTPEEKAVFKTFGEISQKEIVTQAVQRQRYIDQGQSLNLMIGPKVKPKEVNELMIYAWENGIKSLYYQRSANPAQELARSILTCSTCES